MDHTWTQKQIDWLVVDGIVIQESFSIDESFDNLISICNI